MPKTEEMRGQKYQLRKISVMHSAWMMQGRPDGEEMRSSDADQQQALRPETK